MLDENTIHMMSELYRCRNAMRSFWNDEYDSKVNAYKEVLIKFMNKENTENPLEAAIDLATKYETVFSGGSMALLFAASVELSESS